MKHIQTVVFMTLCGVALMFANNVSAQSTKQGSATVVRIQGEARYSIGDNVWHPLVAGKVLGLGAVIQTAVDSKVDLVLGEVPIQVAYPNSVFPTSAGVPLAADPNIRGYVVYNAQARQNVVRLFGDTVLAIDKLNISDTGADVVGDTELDLRAGEIFGSVKKLSAMSEFDVKIPNGIAGIRGTTFTINALGQVSVSEGAVTVSYTVVGPNGQPVMGPNGQPEVISETVTQGETYTPGVGISQGGGVPNVSSTTYTGSTSFQDNYGLTVFVSPICGT